jgi:hypothetical protein
MSSVVRHMMFWLMTGNDCLYIIKKPGSLNRAGFYIFNDSQSWENTHSLIH